MYVGAPGNLAGIATPVSGYPNFQPIGVAKGGSPGQHTPGWDKGWPPRPTPQPPANPLDVQNFLGGSNLTQAVPAEQPQQSNLLNPLDWFRGRNQQTADEVKAGEYQGGKGGSVDSMLRRTSELNRLMNEL
jgi:hypothetical protein